MRELVNNLDGVSVFHCSAGKDRTGMAAALILGALEVPRKVIVEDYLLTSKYYNPTRLIEIIEGHLREAKVNDWDRAWLTPYVSVHEDNINAFLDAIDDQYGSIKNYLKDALKVSEKDLNKLHHALLEG